MHTVFSREKTMAKQDILFGTTALFYKSMGLQGNIRVIYLAFKHL